MGPIYPLSQKPLEALHTYLNNILNQVWISLGKSRAGARIVFVPQSDSAQRLVVDYRGLNKVTIHNKYTIPLMTELEDKAGDVKVLVKLDLKYGFDRVMVDKVATK